MTTLRKLAWNGIPDFLRPAAWPLLLGYLPLSSSARLVALNRKREEYRNLVDLTFKRGKEGLDQQIWHQIEIDVPRTRPGVRLWMMEGTQRASPLLETTRDTKLTFSFHRVSNGFYTSGQSGTLLVAMFKASTTSSHRSTKSSFQRTSMVTRKSSTQLLSRLTCYPRWRQIHFGAFPGFSMGFRRIIFNINRVSRRV